MLTPSKEPVARPGGEDSGRIGCVETRSNSPPFFWISPRFLRAVGAPRESESHALGTAQRRNAVEIRSGKVRRSPDPRFLNDVKGSPKGL